MSTELSITATITAGFSKMKPTSLFQSNILPPVL